MHCYLPSRASFEIILQTTNEISYDTDFKLLNFNMMKGNMFQFIIEEK